MRPTFIVWGSEHKIVQRLLGIGFTPFVDTKNGENLYWLRRYFTDKFNFLWWRSTGGDRLHCGQITEFDPECDTLVLSIEIDVVPDANVTQWVEHAVFQERDDVEKIFEMPVQQVSDDVKDEWSVYLDKEKVGEDEKTGATIYKQATRENYYHFSYEFESDGVVLYEVSKAHCAVPYCTAIENYLEKSHYDLFTNLYVNTSWGLGDDNTFLQALWKNLGMKGECDLDLMVKARIEGCCNGLAEPRVYRMPMSEFKDLRRRLAEKKRSRQ